MIHNRTHHKTTISALVRSHAQTPEVADQRIGPNSLVAAQCVAVVLRSTGLSCRWAVSGESGYTIQSMGGHSRGCSMGTLSLGMKKH